MIGRVLLMVRKDLLRDLRAPLGILLMLAFPLLFAGMLAITFGGGQATIPKVKLLVEDRDGEIAARALLGVVGSEEMARHFQVEEVGAEGRARMERGEASALLVIPEKFTDDLLDGRPTALQLVRNPAEQILPEVAEQLALSLTEILSAGSRALRGPLEELARTLRADSADDVSDQTIADIAVSFRRAIEGAAQYALPPVVTLEAVQLEDPERESSGGPSVFLFVLPGISVFALFMIGDQLMRDILTEAQAGTLRRQLAGPVGAGTLVAAKALRTAVVSSISLVILSAFGWFLVEGGVDLAGFALLALCLILAVTGLAATIYGIARNERQGATGASVVYLFLAFVGGSFFQTDGLPAVLRAVSPYTPFYWANGGFRDLVAAGAGLADVLSPAGLLAALGLVTLVIGSRLLHGRMLKWSDS